MNLGDQGGGDFFKSNLGGLTTEVTGDDLLAIP
jgi:hypothetical protein